MMPNTKRKRNFFLTFITVFLAVATFPGCRHDVLDADGETVSAVITPLQIGPLLIPGGYKKYQRKCFMLNKLQRAIIS